MAKQMTRNYDMNIWDETSYESNGEVTGGWKINFYEYPQVGMQYGSGTMKEELDFYLTEEEAKMLTLGWGPDLGGDHYEDDDFFIDVETFLHTYKDIPKRLLDYLNNLPQYEQEQEPWEPLVDLAG